MGRERLSALPSGRLPSSSCWLLLPPPGISSRFHLPCLLPPFFARLTPSPPPTGSLISMAIKGEVGRAVSCILSRSIIAPFSGDTGAACGTNLPLPVSSQRAREAPPSARPPPVTPSSFPGALPALRGLQLGLSHGFLHTGRVTPADLPRGQRSSPLWGL